MYKNLDQEISANKMSWRYVSRALGMPESTFRNKITDGCFTVDEAFDIKKLLFPKLDMEYLFAKDPES